MAELINEVSSPASSFGSSNFDVFLNFRGEDTRKNFIGFLYRAMKNRGINVFIDNEKLWTGEAIGPALLRAIEGSKISIPVFSKGYASSRWCLLELAQILQSHRSNGLMILPIFFDVEPSHVRNQTGSFEGPFQKHEKSFNPDIVKSWREALRVVGNLKGWVLKDDVNGDQAELVELVIQRVLDELISSTYLAESKYLIGIDSHVNDLLSLLNIGSNDVQFVGICGLGGIGKTTIVKAVYNRIFLTFKRHSFLSDVREQASQSMGLVSLQKQLLEDILKTDIQIRDYHRGKKLIKQRLCKENVLLVLDDVDNQEQVDALAGELNWFGPGSRVIITTRDEHILNVSKVDEDKIYRPQELDHMESFKLFSLHAFSNDQPPEDYVHLSHDAVCYSGGLPLTLEVLGSYLSDINSKEVWESTLKKLKEIPHEKIQKRLKISYDNLEDDYQKAIFLDAACFFIGWKKETAISVWEAFDYYPKSAIHRLIKRSLIRFEGSYLRMHDQVRDMGRKIVLEESFMEPGKRSRLWSHGEILEVLEGYKGTGMIKGMILPSDLPMAYLDGKHLEMMSNVRFLDIGSANFKGEFSCLPSALRWLRWTKCPWGILPTNFYHKRLVYLNLSGSNIEQAWNIRPQDENKLQKLKVLDLSECRHLSKSPDYSWFPSLEQLDLRNCDSLDKLDESIGQLSHLKSLVLLKCGRIKELPESICNLKSLKELILTECISLEELPDGVGLLEKLEVLDAGYCLKLKKLPRSMGRMKCLHSINLKVTSISKFPYDFSTLSDLLELKVSEPLRMVFLCATFLNEERVELEYIPELLEYLPALPSSLVELDCEGCRSLLRLPDLSRLKNLRILCLENCKKLEGIGGLEGTDSLVELNARGCSNLTYTTSNIYCQGTLLPYRLLKNRYSLTAYDGICNKKLILCIVFEFPSSRWFNSRFPYKMDLLQTIGLDISASIYQNSKPIRCYHSLRIEDIEVTTERDIIYVHHFKGFDWFGIPLQGKDAIEILDIHPHFEEFAVKFWKVLFENREPYQQKPDQHSSAVMVADFFNWSYVNDDGGVPSSIERWSQAEGEGSNCVPKELQEEEGVLRRASNYKGTCIDHGEEEASCVAVTSNDGSNQQTLYQPSHVQEKGILLTILDQIIECFGT